MHPSGDNAYSLRFEVGGKVIACSGDTEWTDALAEAARGADLLIAEAYFYDKKNSLPPRLPDAHGEVRRPGRPAHRHHAHE